MSILQGSSFMGCPATRSKFRANSNAIHKEDAEQNEKQHLRISLDVPEHLFKRKDGTSLCGQAGQRESLSVNRIQEVTFPIQYPLSYLRSRDQVLAFAEGVCKKCMKSYFTSYSNQQPTLVVDVYSESIRNYAGEASGFCYDCGSPVDPTTCAGGYIEGKYYSYMCDDCNDRFFETLGENLGGGAGPLGELSEAISTPERENKEDNQ